MAKVTSADRFESPFPPGELQFKEAEEQSKRGCDRSQLTPPLLWQPENSLEKGQLATFSPGLAEPSLQRCAVWARPLSAMWPAHSMRNGGFLFPFQTSPETSSLLNKGP
ncbi:hypothetical protein CB1_001573004 [Camelus ferus]|nr:hypothetical protein CB1_001573004 [Camelus ferus]